MTGKRVGPSNVVRATDWNADSQSLLAATLAATPAQRLAWLEEALCLAYASGALKPRRLIGKEEWDAMSSLLGDRLGHFRQVNEDWLRLFRCLSPFPISCFL